MVVVMDEPVAEAREAVATVAVILVVTMAAEVTGVAAREAVETEVVVMEAVRVAAGRVAAA